MPYRRSSRRRSYGRRRRYARRVRRPNAGRAVPRTTFAPRHQYLKLRTAFTLVAPSPGTGTDTWFQLRLDNAYEPEANSAPAGWVWNGSHAPLGWNAYGSLFQRYVIHGVKVTVLPLVDLASGSTSVNLNQIINWAVTTESGPTELGNGLRQMPISGFLQTTSTGRNPIFKRYFNLNRIMGQRVAMHDRYYRAWGDTTSGEAFIRFQVDGDIRLTNRLTFVMQWYISAVASNARAGDPAAFAALQSMTVPFYGGEQPDPLSEAVRQGINTGVTTNKRALSEAGLGGDA